MMSNQILGITMALNNRGIWESFDQNIVKSQLLYILVLKCTEIHT